MADAQTIDDITLPETKPYRVKGLGATYREAIATYDADGKPTMIHVSRLGTRAEIIPLNSAEARRLTELDAVAPAGEPPTYDEMSEEQLAVLATSRGVQVRSTSADPDQPLREDYINALFTHDLGADEGLLKGAGTVPGGVIIPESEGESPPVLIDGVHPNPPTEQSDDVDTSPADESAAGTGLSARAAGGGVYDARGKSAKELSDWISSEKPNATKTVAAAHDDPEAAQTLIEAENAAQRGDGRATVIDRLQPIADREE